MSDRALLIGIDHYRNVSGLRGCRNDVTSWNRLLVDVAGFAPSGIRTLTDADAAKPNVLSHLVWLAEGAKAGDRLVLQFSGHGSFTIDLDGDEPDGYDELLCLYGYPDEYLLDDEVREWVATVDEGVDLTVIFDSCHSGTMTREVPGVPSDPLAPRRGPLVVVGPGVGPIDATARLTQAGKGGLARTALMRDVTRALKAGGFTQAPQLESARLRGRVLGQARAPR
jgi:hypothetical protein